LRLELLADRTVPAYVVTTTANSGFGSLYDAITQINLDTNHTLYASPGNPSVDEIDFAITAASDVAGGGTGFSTLTGVATITPQTSLPAITNAVFIDGYTQAGASGNTNPFGQADNAVLKVELNGSAAGNANGIGISAPNITVRGLVINRFAANGIGVGAAFVGAVSDTDWIYGNFIGTDPTGMVNEGNGGGILVGPASNLTIGSASDGHDALERNLISGNGGDSSGGIKGITVLDSQNVTIQGNYLGTDATGNAAFTFTDISDSNIFARDDTGLNILSNVISGGAYESLEFYANVDHATIQGNRIGTNAAGTAALGNPNGAAGIYMELGCNNILIGGVDSNIPGAALAGAGNLISGNSDGLVSLDSANVTIQGNYVGTDLTGRYAIPNSADGVAVGHAGSQNVTIGGVTAGTGNLVSGNGRDGISVAETAGPVLIEGNTVGTDATGTYAIGNTLGVQSRAASGVTVGGATQAARNLVSGNTAIGIVAGGTGDLIEGNFVGTDPSGTRAVPNGNGGYGSGGLALGMNSMAIGNLVSGNNGYGVSPGGTGDVVQGNKIGTDVTGTVALANQGAGVEFSNSNHALIGGPGAGQGNLISGNGTYGIRIEYPNGNTGNRIQGNRIGTNVNGTAALGNGLDGVFVYYQPASDNVIGGSNPGEGNVISGNGRNGIDLISSPVTVQGDDIGTDVTGSLHLGNTGAGVYVISNATPVLIGGTAAGTLNTVAFNVQDGVFVYQGNAASVLGNSIHDNGGLGIDLASGANNSQAAPVLTAVSSSGAGTAISGTLASVASTTFRVEFFSNISPNPSGYGEGRTFLGFAMVTTDGSGNASINTTLAGHVPLGQRYLSATATNLSTNDTSAFAKDLFVPFNFSGFLPPLSQNLAFGLNRTIPIKFQLSDVDGSVITGLGAVTSLQVAPVLSGGGLGTPFAPTASGGTGLRNDGTQYTFNWQTKGLTAGSYEILLTLSDGSVKTKVIQLSANGKAGALLIDGSTSATAAGSLLGGNIDLYLDNTNGDLTADELARVQDAVTAANAVTAPYGVAVTEVTDPTLADVTLNMDTTSAVGGYAAGVLGCTTDAGQLTVINGWNFYAGSDATQIGSAQYDFETVVTHELGHALGLGHSTDSTSVMYATLNTGSVNRTLTTADLNVADTDTTGACGLHAAVEVGQVSNLSYNEAGRDLLFAFAGNALVELPVVARSETRAELSGGVGDPRRTGIDAVFAGANQSSIFAVRSQGGAADPVFNAEQLDDYVPADFTWQE
jgi:titin